jgi:hypothetical protein
VDEVPPLTVRFPDLPGLAGLHVLDGDHGRILSQVTQAG